ncbi:MAG: serine/threonine protein phosphatase [Rhodospirillales bacterium]|nr:serine/threonine protein phosphatase [Rhodospirillales bacterium]
MMVSVQPAAGPNPDPPGPRIPDGLRVYAIGDIHGRYDLLSRLHRKILNDAQGAGARRKVVVYLGDYVDRGPASREGVDLLSAAPLSGFESTFLKGNHEDMLLRFLADGSMADVWLMNGGRATLQSYGIHIAPMMWDASAIEAARQGLSEALGAKHRGFFNRLELFRVIGGYVFVHAGLRPGLPLKDQNARDMMWIRPAFLECEDAFEYMVVHGHSISASPQFCANRIGVDTGAYESGRLTCLVFEGNAQRILRT